MAANSSSSSMSAPTFNWEDFFSLADEWHVACAASPSLLEARFRSVISRAYYSVLNLCRQYAKSFSAQRPLPGSGASHDDVITWFYNGETQAHKDIANDLERLRKRRVQADYRNPWGKGDPKTSAADAIIYANRVLNALGGL